MLVYRDEPGRAKSDDDCDRSSWIRDTKGKDYSE